MASDAACFRGIEGSGRIEVEKFVIEKNYMPGVLIQQKNRHKEESDKSHYKKAIVAVHDIPSLVQTIALERFFVTWVSADILKRTVVQWEGAIMEIYWTR